MAYATLSQAQARLLTQVRTLSPEARSEIRKDIFAIAKERFGIPTEHRLRVEVDDTASPDYLVLIRKATTQAYPLDATGRWVDAAPLPTQTDTPDTDADTDPQDEDFVSTEDDGDLPF